MSDFLGDAQSWSDEEKKNWPILESRVAEHELSDAQRTPVQQAIARAIREIGKHMGEHIVSLLEADKTPPPEKLAPYTADDYGPYQFLRQTLFANARSVEQVQRLTRGYIGYCAKSEHHRVRGRLLGGLAETGLLSQMARVRAGSLSVGDDGEPQMEMHEIGGDEQRELLEMMIPQLLEQEKEGQAVSLFKEVASAEKWTCLTEMARNHGWIEPFLDALSPSEITAYAREGYDDGALNLMADPTHIFETTGAETPTIVRTVPDEKRMTPEKLARLLQLPYLRSHMRADAENRRGSFVSNLAIIAEYFCENDEAVHMNQITLTDVETWLRRKFEVHQPNLAVARYQWMRLQGTSFARCGNFIEGYILELHRQEHPWLFDLAGFSVPSGIESQGLLFSIYLEALRNAGPDDEARLRPILPGTAHLSSFQQSEGHSMGTIAALRERLHNSIKRWAKEMTPLGGTSEYNELIVRIIRKSDEMSPFHWNAIEGFELLDPVGIEKYESEIERNIRQAILGEMMDEVQEMTPAQFRDFRAAIIPAFPEGETRDEVTAALDAAAVRLAAAHGVMSEHGSIELVDMANREGAPEDIPSIILPGNVPLDEIVGPQGVRTGMMSRLAEQALIQRHFADVRGGEQIMQYLMRHRETMNPGELILPNDEAPNPGIIEEYADSPDLLSLTQMATLLGYFGYDHDQIRREIESQVEHLTACSHPALTTVGVEWEQIGATPDGLLVGPHFNWLGGYVMAGGNDHDMNELMTAPTQSSAMQELMFGFFTDPRFQFLKTDELWRQNQIPGRRPSSLHLNAGIPRDVSMGRQTIDRFLEPIQTANWLVGGGGARQRGTARARTNKWRPNALLDVLEDKNEVVKFEIRNLELREDGAHLQSIRDLHMIISAGMQRIREESGCRLTEDERAIAGLYEQFTREVLTLESNDDERAQQLIRRYAGRIARELNIPEIPGRQEGIVRVNAPEQRIVAP